MRLDYVSRKKILTSSYSLRLLNISIILWFFLVIKLVTFFGWCSVRAADSPTVFASAGAKPVIDQICREFEEIHGIDVRIVYGGGGEVLFEMILSQSGDIYIAPEQRFMESAEEQKAINPETKRTVAYMLPVIAVAKGNPKNIVGLADLAKPGIRVAVTRPETTLLGQFAPEIFTKAGLTKPIDKNILTIALRPDSVVTMLLLDQVDAGIIWHFYQTLAPEGIETLRFPPEQLTGIGEMQIALSAYSTNRKTALQFIDFVTSKRGKALFEKHGYIAEKKDLRDWLQ